MVNELSSRQQNFVVLFCVIGAFIIHALLFVLHVLVPQRLWYANFTPSYVSLPKTISMIDARQLARLMPRRSARPLAAQATAPLQNLSPTSISSTVPFNKMPVPPSQPVVDDNGHKMYRAGTGFDAPMTTHALAPAGTGGQGGGSNGQSHHAQPQQAVQRPEDAKAAPALEPEAHVMARAKNSKHLKDGSGGGGHARLQTVESAPDSGKLVFYHPTGVGDGNGEDGARQMQEDFSALEPRVRANDSGQNRIQQRSRALDFLSEHAFFEHMRAHALADENDESGGSDGNGGDGSGSGLGGAGGVAAQYGDPRFLHYNRKVYQAMQQSMVIEMNKMTNVQFGRLMHGLRGPTRMRFVLDTDGHVQESRMLESSGNHYYDLVAQAIVKEAAYPPIPRSFGMRQTYHTYGIVLYNDASIPNDLIGVSPYLEGV